jgi:hypothetical protein
LGNFLNLAVDGDIFRFNKIDKRPGFSYLKNVFPGLGKEADNLF